MALGRSRRGTRRRGPGRQPAPVHRAGTRDVVAGATRLKVDELDSVLVRAAHDASLRFDPLGHKQIFVVDPRGAFSGHEACSSQPYITAPVLGDLIPNEDGPNILDNFYHPNAAGQAQLEQVLADAVSNP